MHARKLQNGLGLDNNMKRETHTTVNEYIATFPKNIQLILEEIRRTIKQIVPDAHEVISYQIPCFKLNGKYIMYFAGYKNHTSIYPAPRGVVGFEELESYKGGKGTIQFPFDKPLPLDLIKKIVKYKISETR